MVLAGRDNKFGRATSFAMTGNFWEIFTTNVKFYITTQRAHIFV